MKSELYTKIILTALTIGVFALVYQQSGADGLSPISVAEAKGKASKAKVYNWLYQEVQINGDYITGGEAIYLTKQGCLKSAGLYGNSYACIRIQPTGLRHPSKGYDKTDKSL